MDEWITLTEYNWAFWIAGLFALLEFFKWVWSLGEWLIGKFGIETKRMRNRREDHELLIKTANTLTKLQEKHEVDNNEAIKHDKIIKEELSSFMVEVRNSLSKVQSEISNSIQDISDKIDTMQKSTDKRFEASEEKQNRRVQSDIKERIAQSYRRYNHSKKITNMELEALEDLITTYENHGGENSFVHSVVQKEMYTWEVVE